MSKQILGQLIIVCLVLAVVSYPYSMINSNSKTLIPKNLEDNLILYLPFNEGEGDIAYDMVGNANGELIETNWFNNGTNKALEFNGIASYVKIVSPPVIILSAFSISVFVYYYNMFDTHGWSNCIITQDDDSLNGGYMGFQLSHYDQKVMWWAGGDWHNSIITMNSFQWYHIVISYDNRMLKLWVNGELHDQGEDNERTYLNVPIDIGRKNNEELGFYFHGLINEIKIFNSGLTEEEIIKLYTQGNSNYPNEPYQNEKDVNNLELQPVNITNFRDHLSIISSIIAIGLLLVILGSIDRK